MNVNALKMSRKKRNEDSMYIYIQILDKIWKKIQLYDKNDETNYLYEVPNIILGEPLYDKDVAESLIIRKMKKGGFDTTVYLLGEVSYILIDWSVQVKEHRGNPSSKGSKKTSRKGVEYKKEGSDIYKVTFSK